MRRRSHRAVAALGLALGIAATAPPAGAHPHGWIDLEVDIRFDAEGRITGLHQTWLFDEGYTAFSTQGSDLDGDGRPDQDQLDALLQENLGNLRAYGYFTSVRQAGQPLAFGEPAELATRMEGDRLQIGFLLPLADAAVPRGEPVSYAIYDPSYFIEMVHAEIAEPIRMADAPEDCRYQMLPPNPTAEQVALAAALDIDETAEEGLGALFAEKVVIRCGD